MTSVRVLPQNERYQRSPVPCFEPGCYAPAGTPCIGKRDKPGHRQRHLAEIHRSRAALEAMGPEEQGKAIVELTELLKQKVEKDPPTSRRARRYLP